MSRTLRAILGMLLSEEIDETGAENLMRFLLDMSWEEIAVMIQTMRTAKNYKFN